MYRYKTRYNLPINNKTKTNLQIKYNTTKPIKFRLMALNVLDFFFLADTKQLFATLL